MEQISMAQENHRYTAGVNLVISGPFIWGMFIPIVFLDVCLELYHRVCFPLYGIPLVSRRRYIRIDRQRLSYLDGPSKLYCLYCGYANGVFHYASVIAAMTELYWCPIQHRNGESFSAPRYHKRFATYGEIASLKNVLAKDRTDSTLIGE